MGQQSHTFATGSIGELPQHRVVNQRQRRNSGFRAACAKSELLPLCHLHVCGSVALTPFVLLLATPVELVGRPMLYQASVTRMGPSVAIIRPLIRSRREARGRESRRRRQIGRTTLFRSFATIKFFGTAPTFHPLHRPLVVPSIAIVRAAGCRHGWGWSRRWGWHWNWRGNR